MLVCALPCAHCARDLGCSVHPVFPAPSSFSEGEIEANLGRSAPREREVILNRHHPRMRVIQYAAASRLCRRRLWNNGSPGPGYAKASQCRLADALAKAASQATTSGE